MEQLFAVEDDSRLALVLLFCDKPMPRVRAVDNMSRPKTGGTMSMTTGGEVKRRQERHGKP